MSVNHKALAEAKIRKWQAYLELADDPEFQPYLAGKAAPSGRFRKEVVGQIAKSQTPQIAEHKNGASKPKAYMVNAVQGSLARLAHEFTTGDVEKQLKEMPGFSSGAKNVNIAINDALGTLRKRGVVEPTRRRRGFQRIWRKMHQGSAIAESRTA